MALDKTLKVVAVGRWDDVAAKWVGGDSALDTAHPQYRELRSAYLRDRTDAARDALPLRAGQRPLLWHVDVPRPDQWGAICDTPAGARRAQMAVCLAVTAVTDRVGTVHRAERVNGAAGDAWLQKLQKAGGGALVLELGDAAYLRGLVGDRDEGDGDPLAL